MKLIPLVLSVPSMLFIAVIKGYQRIISPHVPSSCRFAPTCSEYSVLALRKYGLLKGLVLSVHRIFRCHPWGGEGYDPPVWYTERADVSALDEDQKVS
ncbi:MAG: membrane protein insertion efficiency factor YidD [Rhodothermales bacterium]|nr:membrane protein insertion efficiency factor YidD [Rhodothermales bacterium]